MGQGVCPHSILGPAVFDTLGRGNAGSSGGKALNSASSFFSGPRSRKRAAVAARLGLYPPHRAIEVMTAQTRLRRGVAAAHHFSSFSVCPSVHMMGMLAAALTERFASARVSTGAVLSPLRLAEEVELLDQLSGGRVIGGAGAAAPGSKFENFGGRPGTPRDSAKTVESCCRAWTEERLHFQGTHFHFTGRVCRNRCQHRTPVGGWRLTS